MLPRYHLSRHFKSTFNSLPTSKFLFNPRSRNAVRTRHRTISSSSSSARFHDPTTRGDLYKTVIGGIIAGGVFVSTLEHLLWSGEHDHINFRDPGEAQFDTSETVYETTSGVPDGVLGDVWKAMNPNVVVLEETSEPIQRMLAQVRDRNTSGAKFVFYANRLWMLLLEQALCEIDEMEEYLVVTPDKYRYKGSFLPEGVKLCGISLQTNVVEANTQALHSLLQSLQSLLNAEGCNLSQFGEVVVEKNKEAKTTPKDRKGRSNGGNRSNGSTGSTGSTAGSGYVGSIGKVSKSVLPGDISDRYNLIVHPTLSTGNSVMIAVDHLVNEKHVSEDHIMILVLVACPESIEAMNNAFPKARIVAAALDSHLNSETKRIVPGLGDFGARYAYKVEEREEQKGESTEQEKADELLRNYQEELSHNHTSLFKKTSMKRRKTRRMLKNRRSTSGSGRD